MQALLKKIIPLLFIGLVLNGMLGCKKDVDMNNIDKRIQADMGLALPVGNMLFTTHDFLGGGQVKQIYVDADGVYHFIDTVDIPKKYYHAINLSEHVGQSDESFKVYQQLQDNGYLDPSGWVKADKKGQPITLRFPLTLQLKGINQELKNERIDSIQVSDAWLKSLINVQQFGMPWGWINSVDVVLNRQFRRPEGNTVRLYTQGDGYGYNDTIPIHINAFTVSLMKDDQAEPGADNVIDTCGFTFLFNFTVPTDQDIQITSDAAFAYHFETQMVDFVAAWGFFQASNQMRDRSTVCIDSLWSDWKNMKKMKIRLMEPSVLLRASHHIAAPLVVHLDTLMAANATERVQATWNGQGQHHFVLTEMLSPYSDLQDSVWNEQLFNHEADKGHLDQLFEIRPDTLLYSFSLKVNEDPTSGYIWKQHRITNNSRIQGEAIVDIPFKLNTKSEVEYLTKIENVDFTRINLDSLLKSVKEIEKSHANHVKLYMAVTNGLPFDVDVKVWFLRQDSSVMDMKLFANQTENEIHLAAPKMVRMSGDKYGRITEPSKNTLILDVDRNQFDQLTQCKHLRLDAFLGSNPEPCAIDTGMFLDLRVGVAANVEAIVNLNKNTK